MYFSDVIVILHVLFWKFWELVLLVISPQIKESLKKYYRLSNYSHKAQIFEINLIGSQSLQPVFSTLRAVDRS